jgi:6-phosphogluconolactonase
MKNYFRSKVLSSPEDTAEMLAMDFIRYVTEMSRFREKFYIAISGGSTPNLLFDILATEYPNAFEWNRLHFFWVDERCVPHAHIESNFGNAFEKCFSKVKIPKENLHPIIGSDNPISETIRYTGEILSNVPCFSGFPVFDIILLGMGEDGHTASIFPGQEQLFDSKSIVSVSENPISGQKRITLTGSVLNNSTEVVFFITGSRKRNILEQILIHSPLAIHYPASRVKPVNGTLSWYLDKAAAGDDVESLLHQH